MLNPFGYWIVLLAVTLYAFLRGRIDERSAAAICVAATVASVAVNSPYGDRYESVELGVLAVDFLAFSGFTWIALRSDRFWPLWVAGLQLTTLMSHLMKAVNLDLIPYVYAASARFWVYPIFLAIVIGTWRSHQRQMRERDGTPLPG